MVAFHIFPFLVLARIGDLPAYRQRQNLPRRSSAWLFGNPPASISRPASSRVGFMVNSSCSNVRYGFRCAIVGIFRADMFECCQQRHPPFCKTSNFKAARSEIAARTSPDKRADRDCAVLVQRHGLSGLRLPPIFPYSAINFPTADKQLIIDRGNGYDGAYGCPGYGLPDKLGLAHVVMQIAVLCKLGVFFLGHACLDYPAAVRRVVSLSLWVTTSFRTWYPLVNRRKTGCEANCF